MFPTLHEAVLFAVKYGETEDYLAGDPKVQKDVLTPSLDPSLHFSSMGHVCLDTRPTLLPLNALCLLTLSLSTTLLVVFDLISNNLRRCTSL